MHSIKHLTSQGVQSLFLKMTESEDTRSLHLVDTLLSPIHIQKPQQRRKAKHNAQCLFQETASLCASPTGQGDTPMQVCQSGTQDTTGDFWYLLSQPINIYSNK